MDILDFFSFYANKELIIAASLGALLGLERELAGKDPSIRTFSLICLGSCLFSMISVSVSAPLTLSSGISPDHTRFVSDPGRIAAQIVVGIGFLGAGSIYRNRGRGISGLTTAALMWVTAAIGMAVGFNHLDLAISTTFLALIVTFGLGFVHRIIEHFRKKTNSSSAN